MRSSVLAFVFFSVSVFGIYAQKTQKPILHAKEWLAITGKPLGATAGAMIFTRGGNAVDAACAMLGATCTMWDVLSWGGETQALIYNPHTKEVIGINALGVAPTGATADFFKEKEMNYPPRFGPLAAVTPGTPGGLMTMLAEWGTMSLAEVLAPAMDMAKGYPIEAQTADNIERNKDRIKEWPYSRKVYLTHPGEDREAPHPGEIFVQNDLYETLKKLIEAEKLALEAGKSRKEAIYAAYDRFYRGDIAQEIVRGTQEQGGLITMDDLDKWKVYIEKPESTNYKGIDIYKLTSWVQSPVLLQALNMMEELDIKSKGYNTADYLHTLYQIMNLSFADRDFYYGDPYFEPKEPMKGLLSKEYAKKRLEQINWEKNDAEAKPGNPYQYQEGNNPYLDILEKWTNDVSHIEMSKSFNQNIASEFSIEEEFYTGTTSIQAVDKEGWVVCVTPSGGWIPAVIAGNTGVGLSQRMQSFVVHKEEGPYNVVEPGKRPRATLTPTLTLKDGLPFISVAVQGGDGQDQNTLQFLLNMIEFDMNVQEAVEAPNMNSYQMRGSFGKHEIKPGLMLLNESTPDWTRKKLRSMGYKLEFQERTSGPLNAVFFDWANGTFWGGSSNHGEDYGIGW